MAVKAKSRREKIGNGLGLLLGIIGFNLLVPFSLKSRRALMATSCSGPP